MYTRRHGRHTPEESLPGNVAEVNILSFLHDVYIEQDENFRNMRRLNPRRAIPTRRTVRVSQKPSFEPFQDIDHERHSHGGAVTKPCFHKSR